MFRLEIISGLVVLVLAAIALAEGNNNPADDLPLASVFDTWDGCLVLLDESTGQTQRYRAGRCAERHSPCSTFKIPNALIGLDTGVLSGPDHAMKWDGTKRRRDAWNQDHTLRSAMRESVVWYFQEIAKAVGEERMRAAIAKLRYGNQDMSGGLTTFWLDGSLKISADEQVEFLRRLLHSELGVSSAAESAVRETLLFEKSAAYEIYGKTGTQGDGKDGSNLGWYVGWTTVGEKRYVFAANIVGDGAMGFRARDLTLKALRDLRVLPQPTSAPARGR